MDNELFMNTQLPETAVHFEQPSSSPAMLNWAAFMDANNLARNSDCFTSTEQQSIFDSALSSLVSSPNPNFSGGGGGGFGNISSGEMTELAGDPGFAERAARFSCFGSRSFNGRSNSGVNIIGNSGKLTRVASTPALKALASPGQFSRKRKSVKSKEIPISTAYPSPRFSKTAEKKEEKEGKRRREEDEEEERNKSNSTNPPEPPKDYIHVRARRGQATDSHSLAERVRREKIGERMKLLQDLVPGCNKVTGKALMLDEIINYVQSLQRQVEFLSMKLSSANDTSLDFNVEPLVVSKDIMIPSSSNRLHEETLQSESSNHHHQQLNNNNFSQLHHDISSSNMMLQSPINTMETSTLAGSLTHLPTLTQFTNSISQYQMFSDDDLQSIVGMGVAHNFNHESQNMKTEL